MSGSWGKPITLRSELSQEPPSITEKNIPDLSDKVWHFAELGQRRPQLFTDPV
jgi:hypothetical protein